MFLGKWSDGGPHSEPKTSCQVNYDYRATFCVWLKILIYIYAIDVPKGMFYMKIAINDNPK